MDIYYAHQKQKYHTLAKTFLGLMLVYLLFHLFLSERSLPNLLRLNVQHQTMQTRLADLQTQRDYLKDRVVRLRPQTIDPDLVEDYSIQMLGYSGKDAVILLDDPQS